MFNPIINFDSADTFIGVSLTITLLLIVGGYGWSLFRAAKQYVLSEPVGWITPFAGLCTSQKRPTDRFGDVIGGATAYLGIALPLPFILLALVNYAWLPLIIIGGIIAGLKGARSLVSLSRALKSHVEDKDAHK